MAMLNDKQKRFVAEYLVDQNATQAAIRAGYSAKTAKQIGARLLTHVDVAAAVAKGQQKVAAKLEITVERIAEELARIGFSDLRKAFDAEGRLLPPEQWPDDFALAISSVEVVTRALPGEGDDELDAQPHGGALARKRNLKVEYVHKLKLWDKRAALVDLGKHLGMFIDRHEHKHTYAVVDLTDDELAAIAAGGGRGTDPAPRGTSKPH